ncbi:hypothetical protein M3Y99_01705000 [Aphelenchoides fujianensis]|nr:hypothetical protein M3Y99_01705000 [Aphelenchoides fujianensis]
MLAAVCSLLLFASIHPTAGFLFAGAGGSAGCRRQVVVPRRLHRRSARKRPARVPPPRVHDEKTVVAQPLDELELRARLSGVELESQPAAGDSLLPPPRQLELLERLGEEEPNSVSEETAEEAAVIEANVEEATRVDSSTHQPPTDGLEPAVEAEKINCNSHVLKKLMVDAMTENSAVSKRKIAAAAEGALRRGNGRDLLASKGEVTCVAFRQRIA